MTSLRNQLRMTRRCREIQILVGHFSFLLRRCWYQTMMKDATVRLSNWQFWQRWCNQFAIKVEESVDWLRGLSSHSSSSETCCIWLARNPNVIEANLFVCLFVFLFVLLVYWQVFVFDLALILHYAQLLVFIASFFSFALLPYAPSSFAPSVIFESVALQLESFAWRRWRRVAGRPMARFYFVFRPSSSFAF